MQSKQFKDLEATSKMWTSNLCKAKNLKLKNQLKIWKYKNISNETTDYKMKKNEYNGL